MEWWLFLIGFIGILMLLMFIGIPLGIAFLSVNFIFIVFFVGFGVGGEQLVLAIFQSLSSFVFLAIPLFLLMGEMLYNSGAVTKAIDGISLFIGKLPGRLSILTILSGAVFGALSGSVVASTAMLGTSLAPEMKKRGYHISMNLGPILASGGLAMVIPPSGAAIFLAVIAQVSVGKLLIACILPGLLMTANYLSYVFVKSYLKPDLVPAYEVEDKGLNKKARVFLRDLLPLGIIIFSVLGAIFYGVTTVTESAVLGVWGAIFLAIFHKKFNLEMIKKSVTNTLKTTGMIMFILAGAIGYSQLLAFTGASRALVKIMINLTDNGFLVLIVMMVVVLFLGMFLEQSGITMLTIPLFMPIISGYGFDPFWFLVLFLINLQIAGITPPIGLQLFVIKGVVPFKVNMKEIYKSALPFVICDLIAIGIIMLFPKIATYLIYLK